MSLAFTRGSASAAQPRSLWQNPVGIPGGGWGKARPWGFPEGKRRWPTTSGVSGWGNWSASIRAHPRPFAVPPPQRQGRCGIKPGVAPRRRYPGFRPHRVPYPARGCAVRARRGGDKQGRNGIVFAGAEEESTLNLFPISLSYIHFTCHPFEPSAQPRWGCLCLWPLPVVAPRRHNPGLYGRIPLGFPEGDGVTHDLRIPGGETAMARPPAAFPDGGIGPRPSPQS